MKQAFDLIAFDADDTLWHCENLFVETQKELTRILEQHADRDIIHRYLYEIEKKNIAHFGFGIKGFTLSMIETAIQISNYKIPARDINAIIDLGKLMLQAPLKVIDNVETVLKQLSQNYSLALITKGDLLDQSNKIEKSGLSQFFDFVDIVNHKDPDTYARLFDQYGVQAQRTMMIGNSVASDINPVLALGGYALHIPYENTADFEISSVTDPHHRFYKAAHIGHVPSMIADITDSLSKTDTL